jgi:hypothetical protein
MQNKIAYTFCREERRGRGTRNCGQGGTPEDVGWYVACFLAHEFIQVKNEVVHVLCLVVLGRNLSIARRVPVYILTAEVVFLLFSSGIVRIANY